MRLARALLRAVDGELRFLKKRHATNVHVDGRHVGPGIAEVTINSSLDSNVEVRKFVCWERHPNETPTKHFVYSVPRTTIFVEVV